MLAQYTPSYYDAKFATGLCSCNFFLVSTLCTGNILNYVPRRSLKIHIEYSHYIKYTVLRRGHQLCMGYHVEGHQLYMGYHVGGHQLYVASRRGHQLYVVPSRGHQLYGGPVVVTPLQPYSTSM